MSQAHAASMARFWGGVPNPPVPEGANPVECVPFRTPGADVMQRLDCARRGECLTYATRKRWASFTCGGCPVRETVKTEAATRRESMATTTLPLDPWGSK